MILLRGGRARVSIPRPFVAGLSREEMNVLLYGLDLLRKKHRGVHDYAEVMQIANDLSNQMSAGSCGIFWDE